jgi:hypothetical protein
MIQYSFARDCWENDCYIASSFSQTCCIYGMAKTSDEVVTVIWFLCFLCTQIFYIFCQVSLTSRKFWQFFPHTFFWHLQTLVYYVLWCPAYCVMFLKLSRQQKSIKSRADSHVGWLKYVSVFRNQFCPHHQGYEMSWHAVCFAYVGLTESRLQVSAVSGWSLKIAMPDLDFCWLNPGYF